MPPKIILPPSLITPIPVVSSTPEIVTPEKDEEERRPTTPHLSYSQISMYLRCSMQYFFRYVLGLKDRPKVSLSIGKGGHAALEWNTKRKIATGTDAPTEQVVQKASDFIDHYLTDLPPSEYEKDMEPGETKDKFLAATRIYRTRDAPTVRPISAEAEINLDINEYQPEPLAEPIRIVNMKIDLIEEDTKTHLAPPDVMRVGITDYKYVTRKKSQNEVNLSPQLTLYAVAFRKLTGKWPSKLGFLQLHPGTTKDGPNAIPLLREPENMTPEALTSRLRRIAFQFRKVEEGIRAGIFVPTDDPINCSWCGFRDRCQMTLVNDVEAATIRSQTAPQD